LSGPSGFEKQQRDWYIIMARTVAQWMRQRETSKFLSQGKRPTMTKERIQKLNMVDSVCSSIQIDDWRHQGKKTTMRKERIQKMKKIGSVCSIPVQVQVEDWIPRLKELENYQKENGHCRVSGLHSKDSETYPLACWVARQRQQYKQRREDKKGFSITEERIQKLNDIGFEWSVTAAVYSWDERFEELKAFQKEPGHCRVPGVIEKDSSTHQLALWVSKQRRRYKLLQQGKMGFIITEERIQKLNKIGEWAREQQGKHWDESFEQLKAFQKEHGHCRIPGRNSKDSATKQLATWVMTQRKEYKFLQQGKKSRMKEERIQKLNEIGMEWSVFHDWDKRLEALKAFQQEHGHCRVPGYKLKDSETYQLANWVRCQRRPQSKTTDEKIQKLNAIGFDWKLKIIL
jgi:hypothetical protein